MICSCSDASGASQTMEATAEKLKQIHTFFFPLQFESDV